LERARAQRRIARQAHRARQRRQIQAGVGAGVALILIVLGATWALGGFDSKPATTAAGACSWIPLDPAGNPNVVDVGTPPTGGEKRTGTETMVVQTNLGEVDVTLDLAKAPCAAASFTYLGGRDFFKNSSCSMISKELQVVQCGDPKSTGVGGPAYQFADEYRPTEPVFAAPTSPTPSPSASGSPSASPSASPATGIYYKRGDVIMVNTGANTNGSQFYIVYGDSSTLSAAYTVIGTVSNGMDVVDKVVQGGAVGDNGKPVNQGKPKTTMTIQQLYVGEPPNATPSPTTPAS